MRGDKQLWRDANKAQAILNRCASLIEKEDGKAYRDPNKAQRAVFNLAQYVFNEAEKALGILEESGGD